MSETVLADAQFSTQTIFRPQKGYLDLYQGANARRPLFMFPSVPGTGKVETVDPLAKGGLSGYAPNLAAGLKVPLGSRCLIWFPSPYYVDAADGNRQKGYEYVLFWRLRNLFDNRNDRRPYHIPSTKGQIDTSSNQTLVAIPCAQETIAYKQSEPAGSQREFGNIHMRPSSIESAAIQTLGPLLPGGLTYAPLQQGILDPAISGAAVAEASSFLPYETTCKGDELLIGVRRSGSQATWNFDSGQVDEFFPLYFRDDYQFSGIYVFVGTGASFNTGDLATGGAAID